MKLSPEELRKTREFHSLTDKQKLFVENYIVTEDPVQATKAAYNCKNDQVAKVYSYRVMKMPAIIMTLTSFFQDDKSEQFANLLWTKIVNGRLSEHDVEAMKLYARVQGFRGEKEEEEKPVRIPKEILPEPQAKKPSILDKF